MKNLLTILTISMFLCSNVYAQIYYCTDIDRVGFDGKKEIRTYKEKKFKAKITFDPPSFSSSDLKFDKMYMNKGIADFMKRIDLSLNKRIIKK